MRRKGIWVQAPPLGWILYDADCGFCTRWAWRLARFLGPRGYHLAPLQAPWVRQRLALSEEELLCEMRVLTATDAIYGGADAFVFLARQVWWAWPFALAARVIPGMMPLLRAGYRWVARNRQRFSATCALPNASGQRGSSSTLPQSRGGSG